MGTKRELGKEKRNEKQEIKIMNNAECEVIIKSRVWLGNGSGKMEVKRRGAQEIEGEDAGRFIYVNIRIVTN